MGRNEKDGTQPSSRAARLYGGLVAGLEAEAEGQMLAHLLGRVRASGVSADGAVGEDEDVRRFLVRFGTLPTGAAAKEHADQIRRFVEQTAAAVERTPAEVSTVLRLHTRGLYGVVPKPICGGTPRCRACRVTRECEYYNAPPKGSDRGRGSLAQRVRREGVEVLTDEEALALIVGNGRVGEKHRVCAKTLLHRFSSMRGIAQATFAELMSVRDVSREAAVRLLAAASFHSRVLAERRSRRTTVRSGRDFYELYSPVLRDLKKEVFLVVLLDQKNQVLGDRRVSEGTLTASLVHPREVLGPAIREAAAAVAFVHNHPSGDSTPSPEDRAITTRLFRAAEILGIRVLDHVVVGEGAYTSFLDAGLLDVSGPGANAT